MGVLACPVKKKRYTPCRGQAKLQLPSTTEISKEESPEVWLVIHAPTKRVDTRLCLQDAKRSSMVRSELPTHRVSQLATCGSKIGPSSTSS